MEWIINIEGKKNQRIVVKFDPLNDCLVFMGQYKPHNKDWVNFTTVSTPLWYVDEKMQELLISAEQIKTMLSKIYDMMKKTVGAYEEIAEAFPLLKTIEVKEEENE